MKGYWKIALPFALLAVFVVAMPQPELEEEPIEKLEVVEEIDIEKSEDSYIYDLEAIAFYPIPLDMDLQTHIIRTCDARGIDHAVVMAIIERESSYDAENIGDDGESFGLMQIQPKWHQERMDWFGADDLLNPYQNTTVGIDYLVELLEQYGDMEKALVAYNRGSYNGVVTDYAKEVLEISEKLKESVENVYLQK